MLIKLKNIFQAVICAFLALQLGGCVFVDRDRWHHDRWHHDGDWHHGHDDHADIDVNVH